MNSRLLPLLLVSAFLVSACAADPEQVALEQYLIDTEELGTQMSDMGTKFETLMNVQDDIFVWSDSAKQELDAVLDSLVEMEAHASSAIVPTVLQDVHPLLIKSIQEMRMAVEGVVAIAENPSVATTKMATDIEVHATKGEELGIEYAEEMEASITAAYPEMMEE
jgi:hypothetical protein